MTSKTHLSQGDYLPLFVRTTSDILVGGAIDIGEVFAVSGFTHISGFVFSDKDSATPNGIIIEQAANVSDFPSGAIATPLNCPGITRSVEAISGDDLDSNSLAVQIVAPFARVIYVNGAAAQNKYNAFFAARLIRGL